MMRTTRRALFVALTGVGLAVGVLVVVGYVLALGWVMVGAEP